MCGRYTLKQSPQQAALRFDAEIQVSETIEAAALPRYNIAPTQAVLTVHENGHRVLEGMQWGLVPSWAKDPTIGHKLMNARAETLAEKPSFRAALARRRCLVPADGYYEWKTEGGGKQPYYIRRRDGEMFAFAGLWEEWSSPDGSPLRTCTIITVAPNALMASIHTRMPAILRPEHESLWLDSSISMGDRQLLLAPYPDGALEAYPVSRAVNSPIVDSPECVRALN